MAPGRHFRGDPAKAFERVVLQYEAELTAFIDLMIKNSVRSYLEIGSKFGGSLWRIGSALGVGSRVVAVDLPDGTDEWDASHASLSACIDRLRERGCDASVILGDSTDADTIDAVKQLGPFDAIFIDGDHRLEGIQKDWANYGPLGKMVAFHDIAWRNGPKDRGYIIDAPIFWADVKHKYRNAEIKLDPTKRDNGIGVLWKD